MDVQRVTMESVLRRTIPGLAVSFTSHNPVSEKLDRTNLRCCYSVGRMRDDFSQEVKRALAGRVGYRCSRPECAAATAGPQDDPVKAKDPMSIKNAIASVAVKDLGAAVQWYEMLFGSPADSRPTSELAEWKLERGGWLQLYQNAERAGSGSLTLSVDDLDEHVSHLGKCGVDAGRQMINETAKIVMIKDPDGNSIAFVEALDPTIAQ